MIKKFVKSHLISYYNRLNQIGTMVTMKLENNTTRNQARRIVHRLEEFKQVELDFEGIDSNECMSIGAWDD